MLPKLTLVGLIVMIVHNGAGVPDALFEGLQLEHQPHQDAIDELKSSVIAGYERARQKGLAPCLALSVLLTWAAEESVTLQHDQTHTPLPTET